MLTFPSNFPSQAVPFKERGEEWKKQCVDAIIGMCSFSGFSTSSWRGDIHDYYHYYNGIIDDDDYTHVLKPYGKTRGQFPAKLHNYNILKPNVDVLLGEFSKRPRNYSVVVTNPDVVTEKARKKKDTINKNLQEHFYQMLEELGVLPADSEQAPPMPAEVEAEFERKYRDYRAILGQKALNYIEYSNELDRCFNKEWKDYLIAGMAFSEKLAVYGEVIYEVLNPLDVDYDKSPDTDFVEDGDWAARRKVAHLSSVIDSYWNVLTHDEIKALERPTNDYLPLFFRDEDRGFDKGTGRMVEVIRVYWKSMRKIGVCTYPDEYTGQEEECIVEEGYKPLPDEKVEWYWVNEVWEGTRIDGRFYKNVRPCPIQRGGMDNPSKCKLPINGRKCSDRNAPNVSLIALGIPLQLTYNIYKYRLENEVAKSKGMLALLDVDLIPEEFGNGEDAIDKFFYYVEAMGVAFQQRSRDGDPIQNTYQNYLDLTLKTADAYLKLLFAIQEEWDLISGVSRQRRGAMTQYDGKGTTEQSIIQSSHITEDLFRSFEEFIQREYQGLLDFSKIAFIDNKTGSYVLPDGRQDIIDLDGLIHAESEYGVFVVGSGKENRKLEGLRQYGEQLATSANAPVSIIASIVEAENFVELREKIEEVERLSSQRAEQQQQIEQQLKQEELMIRREEMTFEAEQRERDRQTKIEVALITSKSSSGEEEGQEVLDYQMKVRQHEDKMGLEKRKLDLQDRTNRRKLDLDEKKQQTDAELKRKQLAIQARRPKTSK